MRFIHISDLHYHKNPQDNVEADKLLKMLKKNYPNHYLIVTGDITDDGHLLQYENACNALKPFDGKVFFAPGNHCYGVMGNFYSLERAIRFDEMLSVPLHQGGTFSGDNTPVVNVLKEGSDRVMLIALDSNLETESPFDFACGEIGKEQLGYLNTILSDITNSGIKKILFFHHHPFIHNDPFMELKDARDLMRVIYGRVDVLLFGHRHVMGRWDNINGIRFVLASDNSPGKDWVREIVIEGSRFEVNDVRVALKGNTNKRRRASGPSKR